MRLLGNIIWLLFGGLEAGLAWWVAGLLAAITIIGIPFAVQHLKLARLSLMPYGKQIIVVNR
ncbi:MAG TPA: YccF domain-containing protein [Steroidobacteraceae bacterium]|nr:YccF domain-containing protein [Steroidobacteraceae bacterium]